MLGHTPIDTHMELEPKDLGIPLYPRRRAPSLWLGVVCAFLAWLWHRPTEWAAIAVSCGVGGLILWGALEAGWRRAPRRGSALARWARPLGAGLVAVLAMTWLVPFLHQQVV